MNGRITTTECNSLRNEFVNKPGGHLADSLIRRFERKIEWNYLVLVKEETVENQAKKLGRAAPGSRCEPQSDRAFGMGQKRPDLGLAAKEFPGRRSRQYLFRLLSRHLSSEHFRPHRTSIRGIPSRDFGRRALPDIGPCRMPK